MLAGAMHDSCGSDQETLPSRSAGGTCPLPHLSISSPAAWNLDLSRVLSHLQDPEAVAAFLLLQCMWNQDFQVGPAGQHQLLSDYSLCCY